MELILFIFLTCFCISFVNFLTKPIVAYLTGPSAREKKLRAEIRNLRQELKSTGLSMSGDYVSYVKFERKIVALEAEAQAESQSNTTRNLMIKHGLSYGCRFALSLVLVGLSLFYRYTPVMVFDTRRFDMSPFGGIMKFPTGVDGAISVPFWVFVCGFVSQTIAGRIK